VRQQAMARVADGFGRVERKLPGSAAFRAVSVGDRLPVATTLRTGSDAALLIELPDDHMVRVGASTMVVLTQLGADKQFVLKVLSGQIWALVKKANHPAKFTVETSSGVAGVTGTFFGVSVDETTQELVVSTGEGSVEVQSWDASESPVAVTQGKMLRATRNRGGLVALSQTVPHRQMWRSLYAEGAWAQQKRQGPLRLHRGRERELVFLLRLRALHTQPRLLQAPRDYSLVKKEKPSNKNR
jgi:ferric-dicitrate binding protein FerR (iron transport regulator)